MTDTLALGCRSLFINTTARYIQLLTPQPKSPNLISSLPREGLFYLPSYG